MIDQAIRQGDESVAPGLHMSQLDSGRVEALDTAGAEKSPARRITAESFRLLSARLRKTPVPDFPIKTVPEPAPLPPVVAESVAAPVKIEVEPVQAVAEKPSFPVFETAEIEVEAVEPEIAALAAAPEAGQTETIAAGEIESAQEVVEQPGVPVFLEMPVEAAVTEPGVEEVSQNLELSAETIAPEIIVEEIPVAEPVVAEAPVTETASTPVSSVEVQGIGEIAKSIYVTPTSADRTAFLAECAAMAAEEAEMEQARVEPPAIIYSEQFPATKPNIRRADPVDDPFAKIILDDHVDGIRVIETDEDAGELARSLLDMMLSSPSAGLPQERALAADALLKLIPRIPLRALVAIVERVSIMESPPHLLVTKLIYDPRIEVAGPLLEQCNHISDQVLGKVVASGQVSLQRLIARRRHISAVLSDQLIQFDDTSVILTLVRNNGVTISHGAFGLLADHARRHHAVLAPLATRADLPAPIAFELFWFVPAELRRYLLSRFLTDSETLTKILKITQTMQAGENASEVRFPEREDIEAFVTLLKDGKLPEAAEKLAEIGGIHLDSALRVISDRDGEPLAIVFKAMGTNRARFGEILELLKTSDFGIIRGDRETEELRNVFDSMSFNKARVLLTYWDWAALKSGPYAPAN
jgi:Uncharacterised protein conserved in bacteria (DUF2336)